MKKISFIICSLLSTLLVSTVFPNFSNAKEFDSKEEALSESVLYNLDIGYWHTYDTKTFDNYTKRIDSIYSINEGEKRYILLN